MASASPLKKRDPKSGQQVIQKDRSSRQTKYRVRARLIRHPDTGELLKDGQRHDYEETVVGKEYADARANDLTDQEIQERRAQDESIPATAGGTGTNTPISVAIQKWLPDYMKTVGKTQADTAKREMKWVLAELLDPGSRTDVDDDELPPPVDVTGDLTITHLEHLRDNRPRFDRSNDPVANATKNKLVGVLDAMCRDFTKREWLDRNIAAGKEGLSVLAVPKKRAEVPDPHHLAAAAAKFDELYATETDKGMWTPSDMVRVLALGCLRVSEGAGLAPEEMEDDDAHPFLEVQRSRLRDGTERCMNNPEPALRRGKTDGAWRQVTADQQLRASVRRMTRFAEPIACTCCGTVTSGRVLCWPDGTPIAYDELKSRWQRACQMAAVPPIRLGILRHFGVTRAIRAGVDPYRVMKLAGHTVLEQTLNTYAGWWPTDHADVAALLDGMRIPR